MAIRYFPGLSKIKKFWRWVKCSTSVNYSMFIPITEFFILFCTYAILNRIYLFLVYVEQLTSSLIISPGIVTASEKTTCVV